jgi:hypothetical protein
LAPCAHLYSLAETPQPPPPSPFGLIYSTKALLVSQDRRHLFVTPRLHMLCHIEKRKTRGKGSGVKPIQKSVDYYFFTPVPNACILTFSLPAVPRLQLCRRGICHTTNLAIWETEDGDSFYACEKNFPCNAETRKTVNEKKKG